MGAGWYLVADTAAGLRTFRVWRVRSVELLDQPVVVPEGFDLAETWKGIVERIDERRGAERVHLVADRAALGWLRGHFGTRMDVGPPVGEDRVQVELGFGTLETAAMELAGYAELIEVLEPATIREQLSAIGRRLVTRYAG